MTLRKGGFVYTVAYAWRHGHAYPPMRTTLCALFWRCILSIIFIWPLVGLGFVVGLLFAVRPKIYESDQRKFDGPFVLYEQWPRISIFGDRIPIIPIAVVVFFAIAWLLYPAFWWCASIIMWLSTNSLLTLLGLALVALVASIWGIVKFSETEACKLSVVYIRAKKQKVCPTIVISPYLPETKTS